MKILSFLLILISGAASAQNSLVKSFINDQENQHRWLTNYTRFLSVPNVLGDSINMMRNARLISEMLSALGIKNELLYSGKYTSAPSVFGEVKVPGATTTLAFYAHYDGQPVNPKQ